MTGGNTWDMNGINKQAKQWPGCPLNVGASNKGMKESLKQLDKCQVSEAPCVVAIKV